MTPEARDTYELHAAAEARTRSRIVVTCGLFFCALAVLSMVLLGWGYVVERRVAYAIITVACAVASAIYLGAALLAHRTRRYVAAGTMISLTAFTVMAIGSVLDGPSGAFHPGSLLFCGVLAQLATYLLGVRSGVLMGAAIIVYLSTALACTLLVTGGTPDRVLVLNYLAGSVVIALSFLLSLLHARARARMVGELEAAHVALDTRRLAERGRLTEELELATRIQTAILPRDLCVEGLDIAACMVPAEHTEGVGGDYYDVLPVEGGAWLCIGDVAGHGLNAGLIVLMMQSAVSVLAQDDPAESPAWVLAGLNTTLYENVRHRLGRDEHATSTLLRYHRDGSVLFAGAHEDILVLRAAEARCEVFATPGPWMGARPDVAAVTPTSRLVLREGDVMLLYTNGLTEAMDAARRQFGLLRVEAELLRVGGEPVETIRDALLGAVRAFSPTLADDVTILVARYHAPLIGGHC